MKVVIDCGPADNIFNVNDNIFHQIVKGRGDIRSKCSGRLSSLSSTNIPLLSPGWTSWIGEFNISELACDRSEASIVRSANLDKSGKFAAIYLQLTFTVNN